MEPEPLPEITVFTCIYCGYTSADMAGVTGIQYPADIKVVKLPCTGKLDLLYLLKAFEQGADAAMVVACQKGTCHHIEGNLRAEKRVQRAKALLDQIGLGGERVEIFFVTGSQGSAFAAAVEEMTRRVQEKGPNPLKRARCQK
ncbi:MAG: hydrogenase iron-sulfur subunit [Chloroflexia bacterium]